MKLPGRMPRPWPIQTMPAATSNSPTRKMTRAWRFIAGSGRDQYGSTACQSRLASSSHISAAASAVPVER